jgi:hypothetical protein
METSWRRMIINMKCTENVHKWEWDLAWLGGTAGCGLVGAEAPAGLVTSV